MSFPLYRLNKGMSINNQSVNYNELESKGYVIIKSFLDDETIEFLVNDANKKHYYKNHNYVYYGMSIEARSLLEKRVLVICEQIKEQKIVDEHAILKTTPASVYISTEEKPFVWHQDHEPWYFFQQSHEYYHFWTPILKPDPNLSGLTVVPFDILEQALPEYVHKFKRYGSTFYEMTENSTTVYDNNNGSEFSLPINLESIAVEPALNPGDLFLMRGDLIHKTQDTLTHRVAASLRVTNFNVPINKNLLFEGCEVKQKYIKRNSEMYDNIATVFEKLGKDELTAGEISYHLATGIKHDTFRKQYTHFT